MNVSIFHSVMSGVVLGCALSVLCTNSFASASVARVSESGGNFQLLVDGQPFFIRGAGGAGSKHLLKECGGNSFRTWGIGPDTPAQLDEAQKLGLKVTLGIWLGHADQGFHYDNPAAVKKQFETAKAAVAQFKGHPALLCWAVGNEMENEKGRDGDDPLVWAAVNEISEMIHRADPNHPTMTVIAEVGPKKIHAINRLAPTIDIVGINSYGGGPSVARRYRQGGGVKPFVVTEFGPNGVWETPRNAWGAPQEPTSTAKAASYRATYEKTVLPEKDKLCLGSYAFIWGSKQEATATWFGLFMPDGSRLEAVDTLTELWGGKKPATACPQVRPLKLLGPSRGNTGDVIKVQLDATAATGEAVGPLTIEWKLVKDYKMYGGAGEPQPVPPDYPQAILQQGKAATEIKLPADPGGYWLYAVIRDTHHAAATANTPLYVDGVKPRRQ